MELMHGPTLTDHSADKRKAPSSDYWKWREDYSRRKAPDSEMYKTLLKERQIDADVEQSWPQIFQNAVLYFNGRTGEYSAIHLANLVRLCGGQSAALLAKRRVTHVICVNLSASKTGQIQTSGLKSKIHYVRPDWILDSILKRRRQSEFSYTVIQKALGNTAITDYFKNSKSTRTISPQGFDEKAPKKAKLISR
uniref:BRCT domain-containing protein n=1 Tax=Spongospora subterranea TaxID=70186 RepID=A0A0H5RBU6_9EUKA|eukprot:CRZ11705.1 hypothetical protein [Spongospora subterranea]